MGRMKEIGRISLYGLVFNYSRVYQTVIKKKLIFFQCQRLAFNLTYYWTIYFYYHIIYHNLFILYLLLCFTAIHALLRITDPYQTLAVIFHLKWTLIDIFIIFIFIFTLHRRIIIRTLDSQHATVQNMQLFFIIIRLFLSYSIKSMIFNDSV